MILKSDSAFSLVELLVTVTVIGILVATSVASFREYKGRAYDVAARSALRDIVTDFHVSLIDYGSANRMVQRLGYMPGFSKLAKSAQDSFHNNVEKRAVIPNVRLDPDILASITVISDVSVTFRTAHCKSYATTINGNSVEFRKSHAWNISSGFSQGGWSIGGGSPRC